MEQGAGTGCSTVPGTAVTQPLHAAGSRAARFRPQQGGSRFPVPGGGAQLGSTGGPRASCSTGTGGVVGGGQRAPGHDTSSQAQVPTATHGVCQDEAVARRAGSAHSVPHRHGQQQPRQPARAPLSTTVSRRMTDSCLPPWLRLSPWKKLAQQIAHELYPGKHFWKGISLLA